MTNGVSAMFGQKRSKSFCDTFILHKFFIKSCFFLLILILYNKYYFKKNFSLCIVYTISTRVLAQLEKRLLMGRLEIRKMFVVNK